MPVNFPCTKCKKACKKKVKEGEESIHCTNCDNWVHYNCTNLTNEELNIYQNTDKPYKCDRCLKTCLICQRYCKINQKSIVCRSCKHHFHKKCHDQSFGRVNNDPVTDSPNFCCTYCQPTTLHESTPENADEILDAVSSTSEVPNLIHDDTSYISLDSTVFSNAHSSDLTGSLWMNLTVIQEG